MIEAIMLFILCVLSRPRSWLLLVSASFPETYGPFKPATFLISDDL